MPIVEPEVDIKNPDKKGSEAGAQEGNPGRARQAAGQSASDAEAHDSDVDNFYAELVKHPRVLKVVALSGSYRVMRRTSAWRSRTA